MPQVTALLARERRPVDWPFLSGEHGANAERGFHALASSPDASVPSPD